MAKISVIGAGSWGTALAVLLCNNGHQVTLWSYRQDQVEQMEQTGQNEKLPGVFLPHTLQFSSDLSAVCQDVDLLVFAVPSTATEKTAQQAAPYIKKQQPIVSVSKGIQEDTFFTQCEILERAIDGCIPCVLSGPSHAEEVVMGLPTVVVAGSKNRKCAEFVQEVFMNEVFRVYTSPDVTGIEIGASLKNVIALAAGMADGLGFGDNTKAALITRGIKEITDLAVAMGANQETLSGLTGIGDLIVTCSSKHSRNRRAGMYIGQGYTPELAMKQVHMVVEGVYSAKAAFKLGQKYQVKLPIIEYVNKVLFEEKSAKTAMKELMSRDKKAELDIVDWV